MRKKIISAFLLGILTIVSIFVVFNILVQSILFRRYGFAVVSCVSEQTTVRMAQTAGMRAPGEGEFDSEDRSMQIVYQLAKRGIVRVSVKDAAGSGIIWNIDGFLISNVDSKAQIYTFCGDTSWLSTFVFLPRDVIHSHFDGTINHGY